MFFCLFFWNSNVMETVSAYWMIGLCLSSISTLFLKNLMFLIFNIFVFLVPVTERYSQLLIPKKKAPQPSWPRASLRGVNVSAWSFLNTDTGRHLACLVLGSASMNPRICRARYKDDWASSSIAGSGRKFARKVERTCVRVVLTVLPVSIAFLVLPYLFRRQELANADKM